MKQWMPLLLGCLLAATSLAQTTSRREVWEWTDANGVKHYSDAPAPGARKIVILGSTTTAVPANTAQPGTPGTRGDASAPAVKYDKLEIWQPENETSYFSTDVAVDVRQRATPDLQNGDRLLSYLDGKLAAKENAFEFQVTNLERGVHSLTSVIVDPKGNEKIRSNSVVFYIKPPVSNNPATQGPALRPPAPKPAPNPTPNPAPTPK
jgi:Domain of unknown function (DUF4124)